MKKLISLLLCLMMCFFSMSAIAEAAPTDTAAANNVVEVSPVENGTVVPFTDHNFQITLPSDWNVLEITDEQTQAGIIFSCANPESTRSFTIAYSKFDTATTMDAVATELAGSYENVQTLTINGIPFVSYQISANDVAGIVTLDAAGVGFYQFVFYPASDSDYSTLAMQIAASIDTIQ